MFIFGVRDGVYIKGVIRNIGGVFLESNRVIGIKRRVSVSWEVKIR